MKYNPLRTAGIVAALVTGLAVAACSPSNDGETTVGDGNIETIVETANINDPMYEDMTDIPANGSFYGGDNMTAPPAADVEPLPAPTTGALLGEDTLDHAAATGMTSRVDRGAPADTAPAQ